MSDGEKHASPSRTHIISADVAKKAGVSRSTVSRVFADSPLISEETKERVRAIAKELHYVPDNVASSLAGASSRMVALGIFAESGMTLLTRIRQLPFYFYLDVLSSIESAVAEHGYDLLLPSRAYQNPQEYMLSLQKRRVAGAIMIGLHESSPHSQAIANTKIPMVIVDGISHGPHVASLISDNVNGTVLATEHLLRFGHRHIAYLRGYTEALSGRERLAAFQEAMQRAGATYNPELTRYAGFSLEGAYAAVNELLDERRTFTAIMAANDVMAIGALRALQQRGLRVPQDVSVVGFDDIDFAAFVEPPLTTLRQDSHLLGTHAVELLLQLLNGEKLARQVVTVPTRLIVRNSTGPAPQL